MRLMVRSSASVRVPPGTRSAISVPSCSILNAPESTKTIRPNGPWFHAPRSGQHDDVTPVQDVPRCGLGHGRFGPDLGAQVDQAAAAGERIDLLDRDRAA